VGIQIDGPVLELSATLSEEIRLTTYTCWKTRPRWAVRLNTDVFGSVPFRVPRKSRGAWFEPWRGRMRLSFIH
jgi:hypothetical protein